jgi:hypothetical protein
LKWARKVLIKAELNIQAVSFLLEGESGNCIKSASLLVPFGPGSHFGPDHSIDWAQICAALELAWDIHCSGGRSTKILPPSPTGTSKIAIDPFNYMYASVQ